MEIGSNFEWTRVNWTWEYFQIILGFSFKVLKIKAIRTFLSPTSFQSFSMPMQKHLTKNINVQVLFLKNLLTGKE